MTENDTENRQYILMKLRDRFATNRSNVSISENEAKLLEEAIICMEEREAKTVHNAPSPQRKPFFLSIATILTAAGSFGLPVIAFWQTSATPALIASAIGLLVGIAAVRLDPGMKGYWLHDVD